MPPVSNAPVHRPVAVVAQFGGETPVINRTLYGVVRELLDNGFSVHGPRNGQDGILGIDRSQGGETRRFRLGSYLDFNLLTDSELCRIRDTPGAHLGTSKFHVNGDSAAEIVGALQVKDCHHFFMIGGDSTALIGNKLLEAARAQGYELSVVHLPKTIDNDLAVTDHCPGYGSAALAVAERAFSLRTSSDSQSGGLFIAVSMGRNSGFLAAASALSPYGPGLGADLIYLPEKSFSKDHFLKDIESTLRCRRGEAIVVVSEGIRLLDAAEPGGYKLISQIAVEEKHKSLGVEPNLHEAQLSKAQPELAAYLCDLAERAFPRLRVRTDTIGYSVRSGSLVSAVDAAEAEAAGRQGVRYFLKRRDAAQDASGSVVIERIGQSHAYAVTFRYVPLSEVAQPGIQMPEHFIDTYGKQVTEWFHEYAGPLIGPTPHYPNRYLLPSGWDTGSFIHYDQR